jgi:hypothetical protein
MPIRIVHEDKWGVYVKHDGNIYRPQDNNKYLIGRSITTMYKKGDRVNAKHPAGVLWAQIGVEYWHYHGSYIRRSGVAKLSHLCWHER